MKLVHLFFLCNLTATAFCQAQSLNISPVYSRIYFDNNLSFAPANTFGLQLTAPIYKNIDFGIFYNRGTTQLQYDLPGEQQSQILTVANYGIQINYVFWRPVTFLALTSGVALGEIYFRIPELQISIGAQGNESIPARSSNHIFYSVSAGIISELVHGLNIYSEPSFFSFSTNGQVQTNFRIIGGFQFVIL